MHDGKSTSPSINPVASGLKGRCPRCGKGRLFSGVLSIARGCNICKLDYSFADAGDGPTVFVILIDGFILAGLALWLEVRFEPPPWLHLLLWLPLAPALCLASLRLAKGVLVNLQFHHKAGEGRLDG